MSCNHVGWDHVCQTTKAGSPSHHRRIRRRNRQSREKQYVVGAIHTNTIEGFWSIFKRGIIGRCMPLYVAELQFRYNNRFSSSIFGAGD